jgi:hypothetical protein
VAGDFPATQSVELGDQDEQSVRGRMNVRRESRDLVAQRIEHIRISGAPGAHDLNLIPVSARSLRTHAA